MRLVAESGEDGDGGAVGAGGEVATEGDTDFKVGGSAGGGSGGGASVENGRVGADGGIAGFAGFLDAPSVGAGDDVTAGGDAVGGGSGVLEGGFGGAEGDGVGHSAVNLGGDVAGADLVGDKIDRVTTRGGIEA